MPKQPTLFQEVEQFMYTHAQNALYKKQLFEIIAKWEVAYQQRILELEHKTVDESNRMTDEGGVDYEDMRGNRYDDFG